MSLQDGEFYPEQDKLNELLKEFENERRKIAELRFLLFNIKKGREER